MKNPKNVKRGRRARQRGAELQRQAVRMAKENGLEAYNRDRGGAQHELGDIEIEGHWYGCKRRTRIAKWLKPEKSEEGVVVREDRGKAYIVLDYEYFLNLLSIMKEIAE
tara:strand:+ start:3715 stop:4041 length:327 start_codon:yes stop_codon:yes gene_type:complete